MSKPVGAPDFIAHRGAVASHPENTLPAIAAALRCGLKWVEIDVQFSADERAIVIHDEDLQRTAGRAGRVADMHSDELARVSVHEPGRLGATPIPVPPPCLGAAAALLQDFPLASLFVEIKTAAIERLGRIRAMEIIHQALAGYSNRCVIISFDDHIVELARADYSYRIGWVLSDYSARSHRRAQALGPDFLFINLKKVSADEPLFPGPWTWAVYEVGSADQALAWFARGARLVESFQACELARELEQADQT